MSNVANQDETIGRLRAVIAVLAFRGLHDHLPQGWEENYWSLLKKYFP